MKSINNVFFAALVILLSHMAMGDPGSPTAAISAKADFLPVTAQAVLSNISDFEIEYEVKPKSEVSLNFHPGARVSLYCKLIKVGGKFRYEARRSKLDKTPYVVVAYDGCSYYVCDTGPRFLFTGSDSSKFADDLNSMFCLSPFSGISYLDLGGPMPKLEVGKKIVALSKNGIHKYEIESSGNLIEIGNVSFPENLSITAFFGDGLDKFDHYQSRDVFVRKFLILDQKSSKNYPQEFFSLPAAGQKKIIDFDLGGIEIDL
jgi:hypothetical protein